MLLASSRVDADAAPLPYHEKSEKEKNNLYKNIAVQLDRIASDVEAKHSTQLKPGQLQYQLHLVFNFLQNSYLNACL